MAFKKAVSVFVFVEQYVYMYYFYYLTNYRCDELSYANRR